MSARSGDTTAPWDSPRSWRGWQSCLPVLTLLGSAGRAGWAQFLDGGARSWTLGSRHERSPERAAGAVPALPRQPDFPFPLREMQPLPYVGVGGARGSSAAALPLCLRARPLQHRRTWTGPRPRDAPGRSVGRGQLALGAPGKNTPRRTEWKDPRRLPWQRESCSPPGPDAFRRDGDSPDASAGPHQGTAVPGAHPGRDARQHRLPRPGRSAGPRGAWIRLPSAAAAAGSCIPQSPVGPSPRLAAVTMPVSPRTRHPSPWLYHLLLQSD